MHIAYISHEYPPDTGKGGIGTYTFQMAKIMHDLGHFVEVFTASFTRNISEEYNNILTHRVKINDIKEFPQVIVSVFAKQHQIKNFDIIECPEIGSEARFIKENYSEIPLVVRLHTPAVLVTHLQNTNQPFVTKIRYVLGALKRGKLDLGYWSRHDKNQYKDSDFLITQKAIIITAPSDAMKNWAVKFWRISPERIRVIPNPYESPKELLQINTKMDNKRITFLGRLNVLKGLVSLTKSIPLILKKYPDWKFRFIGNDEKLDNGKTTMKQWMQGELSEFQQQIEFIDWIDAKEIPKYMQETDIVVIPSLFESFSYVCVEAMSAGSAIVGSNRGAMNELLGDNEYGLLVNPTRSKQIAKAVIKLIEKPDLRKYFGEKARQRVIEEYNKEKIGKQMEKLYKDLLN